VLRIRHTKSVTKKPQLQSGALKCQTGEISP
jgi:hypothetical protein